MANSKSKHPKIAARDLNEWAAKLTEQITGVKVPDDLVEQEIAKIAAERIARAQLAKADNKNPAAVALGRLGGLKGGKARAEALSAKERSKIAEKAAKTRWERRNEVVRLAQNGKTAKQIAGELGISPEAAKKHVDALKARLSGEPVRR